MKNKIVQFPQQHSQHEKVQLSASSLLEEFQSAYVGADKELQKGYMKLLSVNKAENNIE